MGIILACILTDSVNPFTDGLTTYYSHLVDTHLPARTPCDDQMMLFTAFLLLPHSPDSKVCCGFVVASSNNHSEA